MNQYQLRDVVSGQLRHSENVTRSDMQFARAPIYVQEEQVVDDEFSEMVMNTADRIVNIIWNTKIQKYHETVK